MENDEELDPVEKLILEDRKKQAGSGPGLEIVTQILRATGVVILVFFCLALGLGMYLLVEERQARSQALSLQKKISSGVSFDDLIVAARDFNGKIRAEGGGGGTRTEPAPDAFKGVIGQSGAKATIEFSFHAMSHDPVGWTSYSFEVNVAAPGTIQSVGKVRVRQYDISWAPLGGERELDTPP